MRFKQRKELADKYKDWMKQLIDNNQTMILDCAESLLAWLDINGYLNDAVRCKDCKLFEQNGEKEFGNCLHHQCLAYLTDFCSWGEKKEGDAK